MGQFGSLEVGWHRREGSSSVVPVGQPGGGGAGGDSSAVDEPAAATMIAACSTQGDISGAGAGAAACRWLDLPSAAMTSSADAG